MKVYENFECPVNKSDVCIVHCEFCNGNESCATFLEKVLEKNPNQPKENN